MIRGTTPTFKLMLNDETVDLTQAVNVYATFKSRDNVLTKTGEDITVTANEVDVFLTQKETLAFTESTIQVQLNWTYVDGVRACSNIITVNVQNNLVNEVLE